MILIFSIKLSYNNTNVQYALNMLLSWTTSIKNINDLKNYSNAFTANKNAVLSTIPAGYSGTIDKNMYQFELGSCFKDSTNIVTATTTTTTTTKTATTIPSSDATGLILVIVLPIIGILIIGILAGSISFCSFRS